MQQFSSENRPLSDRTLKYGRNVLAISGTIIVLAWVPDIDIQDFEPLGFVINEGGAKSMWGILIVVLSYYFFQLIIGAWHDFKEWTGANSFRLRYIAISSDNKDTISTRRHVAALTRRALGLDIVFPLIAFIFALVAAITEIKALLT